MFFFSISHFGKRSSQVIEIVLSLIKQTTPGQFNIFLVVKDHHLKTHVDGLLGVENDECRVRRRGTLCLPAPSGPGHYDLEVCIVPSSSPMLGSLAFLLFLVAPLWQPAALSRVGFNLPLAGKQFNHIHLSCI